MAFIQAMAGLAAKVAKADGQVSANEIRTFKNMFAVKEEDNSRVAKVFNAAKSSAGGFEVYARQLSLIVQDNLELKESIVDKLFKIAAVDGFPCQEALDILKKTAQLIKLPDGNFAVIAAVYMPKKETSTMQDYYSVLGVACNAGDKEIKKRWKSLIVQYHPDRLQAQGASQEEIEAATAKMAEINNAYQMIMKAKKI